MNKGNDWIIWNCSQQVFLAHPRGEYTTDIGFHYKKDAKRAMLRTDDDCGRRAEYHHLNDICPGHG